MKIIYKNSNGIVAVAHPAQEISDVSELLEVAKKDVPTGSPFAIVEDSEIPTDRTFRDAWTVDDSILTDGVGA